MSNLKKVYHNGIEVGEIASTGDDAADAEACIALLKRIGLYRQSEAWETAHAEGISFQNCSVRAYEEILNRFQTGQCHPSAFLVNAGFANEMYLKSILLRQNVKAHGHDLLALFKKLNEKSLEKILEGICLYASNDNEKSIANILGIIKKYNNIFLKWRYLHEKNKLRPWYLRS